jgi:N utilization substance protein B
MLVATYELKSRLDVPLKTIINEAIEIDKCLGSNEGHRVINGVLDKLADKFR